MIIGTTMKAGVSPARRIIHPIQPVPPALFATRWRCCPWAARADWAHTWSCTGNTLMMVSTIAMPCVAANCRSSAVAPATSPCFSTALARRMADTASIESSVGTSVGVRPMARSTVAGSLFMVAM